MSYTSATDMNTSQDLDIDQLNFFCAENGTPSKGNKSYDPLPDAMSNSFNSLDINRRNESVQQPPNSNFNTVPVSRSTPTNTGSSGTSIRPTRPAPTPPSTVIAPPSNANTFARGPPPPPLPSNLGRGLSVTSNMSSTQSMTSPVPTDSSIYTAPCVTANPYNYKGNIPSQWIAHQVHLRSYDELSEEQQPVEVACCTWNVNGKKPSGESLDPWLMPQNQEIVAVAFQEIVDLSAKNLQIDPYATKPWEQQIQATLEREGEKYVLLSSIHLVGLALCIWVKQSLLPLITSVQEGKVAVGVLGIGGNKGAVGVSLNIANTTFCFLNAHIAAHQHKVNDRNQHYHTIIKRMKFDAAKPVVKTKVDERTIKCVFEKQSFLLPHSSQYNQKETYQMSLSHMYENSTDTYSRSTAGSMVEQIEELKCDVGRPIGAGMGSSVTTNNIMDHDYVLWLGDLNYRIAHPDLNFVHSKIAADNIASLVQFDQLTIEKRGGRAFAAFQEAPLTFSPTYKYTPGTHMYERRPDKKQRMPSWCDRVQWAAKRPDLQHVRDYVRSLLLLSDHKPVRLQVGLQVHIQSLFKTDQAMRELQKLNASQVLPRISMQWSHLHFPVVRSNIPQHATLRIANTGLTSIRFQTCVCAVESGYSCECHRAHQCSLSKLVQSQQEASIRATESMSAMTVTKDLLGEVETYTRKRSSFMPQPPTHLMQPLPPMATNLFMVNEEDTYPTVAPVVSLVNQQNQRALVEQMIPCQHWSNNQYLEKPCHCIYDNNTPVFCTTGLKPRLLKIGKRSTVDPNNSLWLDVSPSTGILLPGQSLELSVRVNVSGLEAHRCNMEQLPLLSRIAVRIQDCTVRQWNEDTGPTSVPADDQEWVAGNRVSSLEVEDDEEEEKQGTAGFGSKFLSMFSTKSNDSKNHDNDATFGDTDSLAPSVGTATKSQFWDQQAQPVEYSAYISGHFLPSSFGANMFHLDSLPGAVRSWTLSNLYATTRVANKDFNVPKELYHLIDAALFHPKGGALESEAMFLPADVDHEHPVLQSGLAPVDPVLVQKVRDTMDTAPHLLRLAVDKFGISLLALGHTLLHFLDAMAEPLLAQPTAAINEADFGEWVRQYLMEMSPPRYLILLYILSFLKSMLEPSVAQATQVTAQSLALLFAKPLSHLADPSKPFCDRQAKSAVHIVYYLLRSGVNKD